MIQKRMSFPINGDAWSKMIVEPRQDVWRLSTGHGLWQISYGGDAIGYRISYSPLSEGERSLEKAKQRVAELVNKGFHSEPLTQEWMVTQGVQDDKITDGGCVATLKDGSEIHFWAYEDSGYAVTLEAHPELNSHSPCDVSRMAKLPDIYTRYDFIRLCAVLGIPLNGATK